MATLAPNQLLRPIFAFDIDGTLGLYHEHFIRYAEGFLQRPLPATWDGRDAFWRMFGVSKTKYREMKLGYRQGRMKRSMPVVSGAASITRAVRAAGAEVWACTTRPYLRLDNIDPDTRWWLRHHGIQYDGFLYGENKYRDLVRMVGAERVLAFLEDDPDQVKKGVRAGILCGFLIDRGYNRGPHEEVCPGWRIDSLERAQKEFLEICNEWRSSYHV